MDGRSQSQKIWFSLVFISLLVLLVEHSQKVDADEPRDVVASSELLEGEWQGRQAAQNLAVAKNLREQFRTLFENMSSDAKEGYRHLTESVYLPADFDEEVLTRLDGLELETPIQDFVVANHPRSKTWFRFGLSPRPDIPSLPLQYVRTKGGDYVMNCFACHGGSLFGATYPGAPNTLYGLESLTEGVRRSKLSLKKPLGHMEIGSMAMPLGTSIGTSNAVMFGVALMNFRDADLNIYPLRAPAPMTNHDMDAPPWWHFAKKSHIYIDGFAQKGHRGLMQFMLVKENGPTEFRSWEKDFQKVYAFLTELRSPQYPLLIDREKAQRGQTQFQEHCAHCHGSYGANATYPQTRIPLNEIGTDPVRSLALTVKHRSHYGESWFADYGQQVTHAETDGYVAPPLDGIWASAPYFHNGSVPTLWHVLHPDQRPKLWRRNRLGFDPDRVGLGVEECHTIPAGSSTYDRRWYFDTRQIGKSNEGHEFPNLLSEQEKSDLLEYLKTL